MTLASKKYIAAPPRRCQSIMHDSQENGVRASGLSAPSLLTSTVIVSNKVGPFSRPRPRHSPTLIPRQPTIMLGGRGGSQRHGTASEPGAAPEQTPVQLSELAFTIKGHAYEHGIEGRREFTRITAYPYSSTNFACF